MAEMAGKTLRGEGALRRGRVLPFRGRSRRSTIASRAGGAVDEYPVYGADVPAADAADLGPEVEGELCIEEASVLPWEDKKVLQYHPTRFHGWHCSDTVSKIVGTFGEKKLGLMERIGLGGLQYLRPATAHCRSLLLWMLKRLDSRKMRLMMGGGKYVQLNAHSVEHILGIRGSGIEILQDEEGPTNNIKRFLHKMFGTSDSGTLPSLSDIQHVLLKDYSCEMSLEDEKRFSIALAAFCCAHMLGGKHRYAVVPKDIWRFISNVENLEHCNWGTYVLRGIMKNAKEVQVSLQRGTGPFSVRLGGCWLYLEVTTNEYIFNCNAVR